MADENILNIYVKNCQKYDILYRVKSRELIMRTPVTELKTSDITSTVYTISPTQLEFIARIFADSVADSMNMRAFAGKFREIANQSLKNALERAKHMGE